MRALPKETEDQVLKLPTEPRARLAERLIESLDREPADADAELEWAAEAQRRAEEIANNAVEGIPADQAFAKARAALR